MTDEKKTILVIDDETAVVDLIRLVLREKGHEILTAHDGRQGLKIVEEKRPDLILMDVNMPQMGGISLFHHLGPFFDHSKAFPVIVMTGETGVADVFDAQKILGILEKPFTMDELEKTVAMAMEKLSA
ncbi:MAG: response regulator [Candidatus Omnitrophica bacterium]|nr:response regulator [Candidatus Omnitrophota bacterium]